MFDAKGNEAATDYGWREYHEWLEDEVVPVNRHAFGLRDVQHLLQVQAERAHQGEAVDAEDAHLRRMDSHLLIGRERYYAGDVERNVDALVKSASQPELFAANRDAQIAQRCTRISEYEMVHQIREI